MILAGDIGGTKSRLAALKPTGIGSTAWSRKFIPAKSTLGSTRSSPTSLRPKGSRRTLHASGSPGRFKQGAAKKSGTLDYRLSELAAQLRLSSVGLINDLEAFAYGIDFLDSKDYVTLRDGAADATGNMTVVSAGSGLGEAGLYWDGFRHHPFACEGGHTICAQE